MTAAVLLWWFSLFAGTAAVGGTECGISFTDDKLVPFDGVESDRIIHGDHSVPGAWPWVVGIKIKIGKKWATCTGAIVHPKWVVTAGHCQPEGGIAEVGIGSTNISELSWSSIRNFYRHPEYTALVFPMNDIALIELGEPLEFDNMTAPLCLSRSAGPQRNQVLVAAGFGLDVNRVIDSNLQLASTDGQLKEAFVQVQTEQLCAKTDMAEPNDYFCVGNIGTGVYKGDSGSAVVRRVEDHWVHVGIVSAGTVVAVPGERGITTNSLCFFTKTAAHCDWIEETTGGEVVCGV